jgi:hypothetical protein
VATPSSASPAPSSLVPQSDPASARPATVGVQVDLQSGSSVDGGSVSAPVFAASPSTHRPVTKLQHGIHKPKVYTDSTIHWGLLGTCTTGEPGSVDEAFGDQKWVAAMDNEHQALLQNKTCILFLSKKGRPS